jgi:hypothetical protein
MCYGFQVPYVSIYLATCALVMVLALVRGGAARNYLEFCQTLGICLLWPLTLAVEVSLARANRTAR